MIQKRILGLHHVTAIAGDPQRNVDFYTGLLGLRLVKLTVNYDDPGTYHLYFGDEHGNPGTILTFFPWPGAQKGRRGTGQATAVSFSIPEGSMGYWTQRFKDYGVTHEPPMSKFERETITFLDPDGLQLEMVESEWSRTTAAWKEGPISGEQAIRGFHGVTITEDGYELTASMLTKTLSFRLIGESGNTFRYETGDGGPGTYIDVICRPDAQPGVVSLGTIHHIAWRTPTEEQQRDWRQDIFGMGLNVTPVIDRRYFRSIYFREPGGVLFEIATDQPGFAVDETPERLGSGLVLPPWLEPMRQELQRSLPPLRLPEAVGAR